MEVVRNANGLYTFDLGVKFKNITRKITGLVDTGSNICACTYKVPTTLRAKPTFFGPVATPAGDPFHTLAYSLNVGFDGKSLMTHVYRLPLKMDGIDFILGLSILSQCNITMNDDRMTIEWR